MRIIRSQLPTIGIDCRFAATSSGIGRYVRELVKELTKRDDPWNYVLFLPKNKDHELNRIKNDRILHYPLSILHYSLKEQILFPKIIKTSNIDILHVPHFNVPLRCPVPVVTTIHDLILHEYPNEAGRMKRIAYKILMKHAVQKSEHIIAVSEATKKDILKHYKNVHNKISVIHNGISDKFLPKSKEEVQRVHHLYNLPDRFALYVGASKEHKNVQTLINACPSNLSLILITSGKESINLQLRPNVIIIQPDDDDLPAIYSAASIYVQPSHKEGFGIPVLEAMACGTPVVASNTSSLSEVSGKHAISVEPSEKGLMCGIKQGLKLKKNLNDARMHAQKFTWEKAAGETAKVYQNMLYLL